MIIDIRYLKATIINLCY